MNDMSLDVNKLAAAKLWLISAPPSGATGPDTPRDLPYLTHALYALIPVASDLVPRATCDEWWRIYINPTWLNNASVREVGTELAHMAWHLLSEHTARARDQSVDRSTAASWNRAADFALVPTLKSETLIPQGFVAERDMAAKSGLSAEQYYAILSALPVGAAPDNGVLEPQQGCGSGVDGVQRSHELGADAGSGALSSFDGREIRRRVAIEYSQHARSRGTLPGDALRWVRETLEPTVSWASMLAIGVRRAVGSAAGRGQYTYARPSRRSGSVRGVILPGQHRRIPQIAVIVDTSASVDDALLARALGEVDNVIRALGVAGCHLTLYSVDAAVHTVERLRSARDATLVGAGGTDLRIGLRAIEKQRPRPDVAIVFTDGGTPWPSSPPLGTAVLIAVLGRLGAALPETPAWATRVECLLDDA